MHPAVEIEALLASAFAVPPDATQCGAGLRRIATYLSEGNLPLAMIAAVQLRLGDIREDRIERLARADRLLKAGFNPDEPRDAQGRWTDEIGDNFVFILDDLGDGQAGGAGSSGRNPVPTSAGGSGAPVARVWEQYPNADFRNRLAIAEQSAGHKNFGYGEVLDRTDSKGRRRIALGRYRLTPPGLQSAGMIDDDGRWTGKYGIRSRAELLADPEAQERALTDYLANLERQLRANGAFAHIGETINGQKARFPVTRAGIIAAAHREGALRTADYLNRIKVNGLTSKGIHLKPWDPAIETRLRIFSAARYE